MLKLTGIYKPDGTFILEGGKKISWNDLSDNHPPDLPPLTRVELIVSFKENDLLEGTGGIVWATFDLRQAEIIQSTLLAQQINSKIKQADYPEKQLFLVEIINETEINDAIEFIWRGKSGLRLKPDWNYAEGEKNTSFEQWLSGQ